MQPRLSTTPFGRRSLTLAHVATQAAAKGRPPEKVAHKWEVFRAICMAKARIGVTERALAVLDALLTFHPETALTGENLIVFPSNVQLSLRAHGMAPATLRRHLAVLVDCGLIIRRDSPNGKRFARKGAKGDIEQAFGFDLSPIVARAEEFQRWAEEILAEERATKLAREKITICRRDIVKMIATGMETTSELSRGRVGRVDWEALLARYRSIIERLPRQAIRQQLEPIADELGDFADEIVSLLEAQEKISNISANESQTERHKQNSNPKDLTDFEPDFPRKQGQKTEPNSETRSSPDKTYPLGLVLDACPDIIDYAKGGIGNWRDFLATANVVRPILGISPSAIEDAQDAMGERNAAITIAAMLQRGAAIKSAGGYLRELTQKSRKGEFSVGPMLMALLSTRMRTKQGVG